jgi:hypothetical protein
MASIVSSLAGIDAVAINVSEMVNKTLMINYAILIILVVNSMNLFGK